MIRISCVSYLNSRPFIDGIERSGLLRSASLSLDVPSVCAEKLISGGADIGLIPVVTIAELEEAHIVSDYCIGADGPVETVLLLSDVPLHEIDTIVTDGHSRTSVLLTRVLADRYWNIQPRWHAGSDAPGRNTARLLIGDKTFTERKKHRFSLDLAEEWQTFTTLPFVFACWVATRLPDPAFLAGFNAALASGVNDRHALASRLAGEYPNVDIHDYLDKRISYILDDRKRQAMDLFSRMIGQLAPSAEPVQNK